MQGSGDEALLHLLYAAELSRRAGFREGEIWSLLFLGELGIAGEKRGEGLRAAEMVRERADRYRAAAYRIWARLLLARYYREGGRIGEAITALEEADAILSIGRSGGTAEMFDPIPRRQRRALYETLVELLAGEKRAAEALTAAEKAKTLMTVDLLSGEDIAGVPGSGICSDGKGCSAKRSVFFSGGSCRFRARRRPGSFSRGSGAPKRHTGN